MGTGSDTGNTDAPEAIVDWHRRSGRAPRILADTARRGERGILIAALAETVGEFGYEEASIERICRRAGLSPASFAQHFEGRDGAFVLAYVAAGKELGSIVTASVGQEALWRDGVKAGVAELLGRLAGEPNMARFFFTEGKRGGRVEPDLHERTLEYLTPFFRADLQADAPALLEHASPVTLCGLRGGIASIIERRVGAGEIAKLETLYFDIVSFSTTPFIPLAD